MVLRSRFAGVIVLIVATTGCSHGTISSVPTAPTTVTPAVTMLRLSVRPTGGGALLAGSTAPITTSGPTPPGGAIGAYAEYTDGSGQFVEATWTSSDPAVAVVTDSTLRAIGRGTAILTARAQGHTASETFRVDPGIPGAWSGNFIVEQCGAGSGSMQDLICNGLLRTGTSVPVSFVITQSGTALTATAAVGTIRGTLTGTDRGGNFLTLMGDLTVDRTTLTMVYWDSRVIVDVMEGGIGFEVRTAGLPSHAQVIGRFSGLTRR